jgi:hypothetical protein
VRVRAFRVPVGDVVNGDVHRRNSRFERTLQLYFEVLGLISFIASLTLGIVYAIFFESFRLYWERFMPTVLQIGPYSFIFFSSDLPEPPHIHVKRDRIIAKYWLEPISLAKNRGFRAHELTHIAQLIVEHQNQFLEAWHDHFNA